MLPSFYILNAYPNISGANGLANPRDFQYPVACFEDRDVTNFKVGERVAYAATIPGAYTEARVISCDQIVKIPEGVSNEIAAASALKGMTAEYLVQRCYRASKGDVALVHAAAGGVGQILCQWLNYLGVTVIGTTSSENKKEIILHLISPA